MDKAEQTMLDNLLKNTGKSLDQWITIVRKENFEKHGQISEIFNSITDYYPFIIFLMFIIKKKKLGVLEKPITPISL